MGWQFCWATRDAVQWWRVPIHGNMSVDATAENHTGLNWQKTTLDLIIFDLRTNRFPVSSESVVSDRVRVFFEFPIGTFALLDYLVVRKVEP